MCPFILWVLFVQDEGRISRYFLHESEGVFFALDFVGGLESVPVGLILLLLGFVWMILAGEFDEGFPEFGSMAASVDFEIVFGEDAEDGGRTGGNTFEF